MKLKRFGSLLARSGLISLVLLMVINLALPLVTSQVRLDQDVISDNHAIILGKVIPRVDAACVIDGENTDQESEEACQDAGGQWLSSLEDQEGGEIDTCYQGGLSLGWIICPIIEGFTGVLNFVEDQLVDALENDPKGIEGTYDAWVVFRDISIGGLAIVVVFMIISSILRPSGDAGKSYDLKRTLPRLFIAFVAIYLSFTISNLILDVGNVLAEIIRTVMLRLPGFGGDAGRVKIFDYSGAGLGLIRSIVDSAALLIGMYFLMTGLLGTAVIGVLLLFFTVAIRKILVILLVLFSPVALLLFVLPQTNSMYKKWFENIWRLSLMYPMVIGIIYGSEYVAFLIASQKNSADQGAVTDLSSYVAFVVKIAPLFLIPATFKMAGSLVNLATNKVSGLQNAGKNKLNSAINRTPYIGSDSLQRKARKANKDKYRQEKFQRAVSGNLNPEESSRLKRRLGMWSAGVGIKDLARGEVKENTPEAAAITRFVSESDEIKRRERKEQYQVHTNNLVGDDLEVYQNLIVMQQLFRDMHGIEDGRKFTDAEQRGFIDFYNGAVDPRHQVDEDRIRRVSKAARIKFDDFMSLDGNLSIEVLDKMFEGKKVDSIKALNNAMIQDPSAGGIGFNIKHPPSLSENQVGALFADMSLGKYRGWAKENMGQMIGYGADKLTATEFLEQKKQGYDMMAERIEAETDPAKKAKLVNDFVKAAEKAASDPKAVSAGYTDEKGQHIIATLGRIHASPADIDSFKTKLENTQQGLPQSSSPVSPSSYMTLDIQERISRGEGGMYSAVGTPGITMQERVNTVVSTAQAINNPYLRDSANATQLSKGVARQAAALIETTSPAGIKGQMTQAEFVTRHGGAFSTPAEAIDAYDQLSSVIASMDVDRSRTTGDIVDAKFRV